MIELFKKINSFKGADFFNMLKKNIKAVLVFLAILLCVIGYKSCSSDSVFNKSVYRIGRPSDWYSMQLYGREKNLVGFTNDIMAYVAAENHIHFEWVQANSATITDGLEMESYDFILSNMRPNIVNEDRYNFSELVFELGPVLIVRQKDNISSLEEMSGRTLGVLTGFSLIFNAIRNPGAHNFDLFFLTYNNINRALDSLLNKQIDGVILNTLTAYTVTQGLYINSLKVVTPPFNDEGIRFVSLEKSHYNEIIDKINLSLNKMRVEGTYQALIEKWDLVDAKTAYKKPQDN